MRITPSVVFKTPRRIGTEVRPPAGPGTRGSVTPDETCTSGRRTIRVTGAFTEAGDPTPVSRFQGQQDVPRPAVTAEASYTAGGYCENAASKAAEGGG